MKRRHWFIALFVAGVVLWFLPLPKYIIYSISWSCFSIMVVMIFRSLSFSDDCMIDNNYGPTEPEEWMRNTKEQLAKRANYGKDHDDIDWDVAP